MTTALALYQSASLTRLEVPAVFPISTFMGRRERLHFAFLHAIKRLWIQGGQSPMKCEEAVGKDHVGRVRWWHTGCDAYLGRRVEMHLADDEVLMAVVVPVAKRVEIDSPRWSWYPDGWVESIRWAQAGCPMDASDAVAAKVRSQNANVDRFVMLEGESRLDAAAPTTSPPALRIVQIESSRPLFRSEENFSMDMEAEYDADFEDVP